MRVDRSRVLELVRDCDVFVQGFHWGSLARLGLGLEKLSEINSRSKCLRFPGPLGRPPRLGAAGSGATGITDLHSAGRKNRHSCVPIFNDCGSGYLGAPAALLRRADEGGSWSVRVALAKTAMLGTHFARTRRLRCRSMMPAWTATSLIRHPRSGCSRASHPQWGLTVLQPTLGLPVAFPAHRRWTLAEAPILSCRTPYHTGGPRSFVLGSHGGGVRKP
jgi:hypothetical protein